MRHARVVDIVLRGELVTLYRSGPHENQLIKSTENSWCQKGIRTQGACAKFCTQQLNQVVWFGVENGRQDDGRRLRH